MATNDICLKIDGAYSGWYLRKTSNNNIVSRECSCKMNLNISTITFIDRAIKNVKKHVTEFSERRTVLADVSIFDCSDEACTEEDFSFSGKCTKGKLEMSTTRVPLVGVYTGQWGILSGENKNCGKKEPFDSTMCYESFKFKSTVLDEEESAIRTLNRTMKKEI